MALYPDKWSKQEVLQPGADGQVFQNTGIPGYREKEDRINRTNNNFNVSAHDVLNCKYLFDDRLPVLFKYGWGYGYTNICMPKGRICSLDPSMDKIDFDTKKQWNVLTLANGGVPVRLRTASDKYMEVSDEKAIVSQAGAGTVMAHVEKEWIPLVENAYTETCFRPFKEEASAKKQLEAAGYSVDPVTGRVIDTDGNEVAVRQGNKPIGLMGRNQYDTFDDAQNGIMVSPIYTDCLIELPYYLKKDSAEKNFWGSVYGGLTVGDLLKSDENGRITLSPLSTDAIEDMSLQEYEAERQQVIGEVYSINRDLVPEGAARFAQWALGDRMNFSEYSNTDIRRQTNRREDNINNSPYAPLEWPGYPFDRNMMDSDLHMLASGLRQDNYNIRMQEQFLYERGIPGLTDGRNVARREIPEQEIGRIHARTNTDKAYVDRIFRISETNIAKGSLQVKVGDEEYVNVTAVGQTLDADGAFTVVYMDELQGLLTIRIDPEKGDAYLNALDDKEVAVYAKFAVNHLNGVPTMLDFEGVVGTVKVLLTK